MIGCRLVAGSSIKYCVVRQMYQKSDTTSDQLNHSPVRSYQLRVLLAYMTIWVLPHFSSRMSVTLHSEVRVCNGSDLEPTVITLELVGPIMIKVER